MRPVKSKDICYRTPDGRQMVAVRVYQYTKKSEEITKRIRNMIGGFIMDGPTIKDYTRPCNGQVDIVSNGILMVTLYRDDYAERVLPVFPQGKLELSHSRRLLPVKLERALTTRR